MSASDNNQPPQDGKNMGVLYKRGVFSVSRYPEGLYFSIDSYVVGCVPEEELLASLSHAPKPDINAELVGALDNLFSAQDTSVAGGDYDNWIHAMDKAATRLRAARQLLASLETPAVLPPSGVVPKASEVVPKYSTD